MTPNDKLTAAQLELLLESDPWSSLDPQKREPYWVIKKRMDAERAERREREKAEVFSAPPPPPPPPSEIEDLPTPAPAPVPPTSSPTHTCGSKQPNETWGEYGARNKNCPACATEEEAELDAGFIGRAEDELEVARPGEVEERPGEVARRYNPGEFGTGRPAPVHPDDSRIVKILKTLRDTGGESWTRRGDPGERAGKRIRKKELCKAFHTCPPYGGQTYSIPTDDEFGSEPKPGSLTFNNITGAPHPEYLDYYLDKAKCEACRGLRGIGDKEFCANRVSTEFGRAKPYCREHIQMGQSYPQEVAKMLGELPEDHEEKSRKEATSKFREKLRTGLQTGDRVKFFFNQPGLKGTGHLIGTIVDIDPNGVGSPEETHRIHWDNPKAQALTFTWEDPFKLDSIDVRDKPYTGGKELKPGSGQGWPPPSGMDNTVPKIGM